jgi:glycosyltransferase involved in cell wall biosynthesis
MLVDSNKKPAQFSVVIPTKDREHTILRALTSLRKQTWSDWDAIVVDDHSSRDDETEQLVASLQDDRISFIRQTESAGAASARNLGVQHSSGRYIAFLDSDDYYLPEKLETMHSAIEKHPNASRCVFYSKYRAERVRSATIRPARGIQPDESIGDYLFVNDGLMQTSGLVMSRSLALSVPFDEGLMKHQDYDLVIRLQQAGAEFHFVPKVLTVWSLETEGPSLGASGSAAYSIDWVNSNRCNLSAPARNNFLANHVLKEFSPWRGRAQYLARLRDSGCWKALSPTQKLTALSLLLPTKLRRAFS